eukprot:762509-Hanusia_phi.AAC.3
MPWGRANRRTRSRRGSRTWKRAGRRAGRRAGDQAREGEGTATSPMSMVRGGGGGWSAAGVAVYKEGVLENHFGDF